MAHALLYLRVTSLVGRVRSRLRRLRQPKYLAGALVGAAYVYFSFLRRSHGPYSGHGSSPNAPGFPSEVFAFFPELAAVVLLVILVVNWATPRQASLAFSEAEIAFLFPAPVNRRLLVHYRVLGSQLAIVFTALILAVVFGRGRGFGGNPWFHAVGWWLILATLNLHFTGTSFVYSKLLNRSMTTGRRKVATIGLVWVLVSALIVWAWSALRPPQQSDLGSLREFANHLGAQLRVGPLRWLLMIPQALVAPYFADSAYGFLRSLGPAFALLVTHYFWVVHTEVSFEEASIARAEKRAARIRAVRQGDWRQQSAARKAQPPPFNLQKAGRPETAFLWKNLLASSGFFRPKAALVALAIVVGGCEWLVWHPLLQPIRLIAALVFGILLAAVVLLGPLMARQDLRSDLSNSDILKTYPLRGWQIALGELLAPVSILSTLIWLCLLAEVLLLPADKWVWLTPSLRAAAALSLAVLAPPFVAVQLLVPNAAAVVFPAWAQSAGDRTERGIEVLGQRIIFLVGQLLITAVAIVPAAIIAAVIFVVGQWLAGLILATVLAVLAVFSLLALEACLGVRWLGNRFEHFDLSAELRP
jgi:ABC-2 type transport system permease protein